MAESIVRKKKFKPGGGIFFFLLEKDGLGFLFVFSSKCAKLPLSLLCVKDQYL
jgi:ribosomal protein L24E